MGEFEEYDGPVTLPRLDDASLREDTSILGGDIEQDRIVVWIDPLDATQEYTEGLTQYVTVMVGIAVDGRALGGVIYKPFLDISNSTAEHPEYEKLIWAWKGQRSPHLGHLHIMDEVEMNRVYHEDEDQGLLCLVLTRGKFTSWWKSSNPLASSPLLVDLAISS